jgi:hypothetical protein
MVPLRVLAVAILSAVAALLAWWNLFGPFLSVAIAVVLILVSEEW